MKKIISTFLLFTSLTACNSEQVQSSKTKVVATFYPLAYFAERIGGDAVEVSNLTPVGGEPHDFEPSPRQIVEVTEADLALYLGLGFEPWMEDLETELKAKGVVAVEVNSRLDLIEAEEETHEESAHDHGTYDPHTWLDPLLAQEMVSMILDGLVQTDPQNEALYTTNAQLLNQDLQALHEAYSTTLQNCETKTVLTSHDAFSYLAHRYNLETVGITGLSPEDEPSADRLVELADFAKAQKSQYIFFETLANPDVAETLAEEANLTPLMFNPVEGLTTEQAKAGENYFTLMQANLDNLKLALACQ